MGRQCYVREVHVESGLEPRARGRGRLMPTRSGVVFGVDASWYVRDLRRVAEPQFRGPLVYEKVLEWKYREGGAKRLVRLGACGVVWSVV